MQWNKEYITLMKGIEGFPKADICDFKNLSKLPYYTSFPNPFIHSLLMEFKNGVPINKDDTFQSIRTIIDLKNQKKNEENLPVTNKAFSIDLKESRADPIYQIHPYHTKVPYKAIKKLIEHYSKPGDIILDPFSGSGQTGLATQLCEKRISILVDISPLATWLSYNYNYLPDNPEWYPKYIQIINEVKQKFSNLYLTDIQTENSLLTEDFATIQLHSVIWECEIYCPNCNKKISSSKIMELKNQNKINNIDTKSIICIHCGARISTKKMKRVQKTKWDDLIEKSVLSTNWKPIKIKYKKKNRLYTKKISDFDRELLEEINAMKYPSKIKTFPMLFNSVVKEKKQKEKWGELYCKSYHNGMDFSHQFYFKRTLIILNELWNACDEPFYRFMLTSILDRIDKRRRLKGNPMPLILYIPQIIEESNVFTIFENKLRRTKNNFEKLDFYNWTKEKNSVFISTQSATDLKNIPDNSIDYIFTDPPFGRNIIYSEANFLWESWLRVFENNEKEAIITNFQKKKKNFYFETMKKAFNELYRILKPDKWITVEFHNSSNEIWNMIQNCITEAGFIISDIRVLDKVQSSFKQITEKGAVKKDLIISSYKPNENISNNNVNNINRQHDIWLFVEHHLQKLSLPVIKNQRIELMSERQNFLIYDRMIAHFIKNGLSIPYSSAEFYRMLEEKFPARDEMYFLPQQIIDYDNQKLKSKGLSQSNIVIKNEKSAITWLKIFLQNQPRKYDEIQPEFLKNLHLKEFEKLPEMQTLLDENFLYDLNKGWYIPNLKNKQDLKRIRRKKLLKEFNEYKKNTTKLRFFRTEAISLGFETEWDKKNYENIVKIANRLPENFLNENIPLLMYYDNAKLRIKKKQKTLDL